MFEEVFASWLTMKTLFAKCLFVATLLASRSRQCIPHLQFAPYLERTSGAVRLIFDFLSQTFTNFGLCWLQSTFMCHEVIIGRCSHEVHSTFSSEFIFCFIYRARSDTNRVFLFIMEKLNIIRDHMSNRFLVQFQIWFFYIYVLNFFHFSSVTKFFFLPGSTYVILSF